MLREVKAGSRRGGKLTVAGAFGEARRDRDCGPRAARAVARPRTRPRLARPGAGVEMKLSVRRQLAAVVAGATSIAGAVLIEDYVRDLKAAGFSDVDVETVDRSGRRYFE